MSAARILAIAFLAALISSDRQQQPHSGKSGNSRSLCSERGKARIFRIKP